MDNDYIKQNTHSKWYYIKSTGQKKVFKLKLSCTRGEEKKKGYVKSKAKISWNTENKSEAYKYTIKMISTKITSRWITDDFEYVAFVLIR